MVEVVPKPKRKRKIIKRLEDYNIACIKNGIAIAIAQCRCTEFLACSPRVQLGDDAVIVIVVCQHGVIETIVLYCYRVEIKTEAKDNDEKD